MRPFAPHCAALGVLVSLALAQGPILWDLARVYRGSLDTLVLAGVISSVGHVFLWIVLWLCLSVKVSFNNF